MEKNTTRLLTIALLMAAELILTRFLSIDTPIVRIGFGFLPIAIIAILYGGGWAGLAYAIGDILGSTLFPKGAPFPGFTLSAFLTGLVFGIFFHKKPITWKTALPASLIIAICIDLILNTYWLSILMGKGFLVLMPARILKAGINIAAQTILIPLVYNKVIKKIPGLQ